MLGNTIGTDLLADDTDTDASGDAAADPLDFGVLGAGNIGMVHLQSALAMDGVAVHAVADALPENRQRARDWGVETVYEDYADLLRHEPLDACVVALPPFLHREAVELAADVGVDVFVEKPFARSVEEADAMLDAAADVAVGVDHTIRYQPEVREMYESFEAGSVGHVPFASISRVNNGPFSRPPVERTPPEWPLDPDAAGGGALLELGVHLFDVLEWFFGELEVLDARTGAQLDLPVEDAATVMLRSVETGTVATLHCGTYQWEDLPEVNMTFRLEGVAGTLDSTEHEPGNFYANAARSALDNVRRRLAGEELEYFGPTYYLRAHYLALQDFVTAIRRGESPPVDGTDGRRAVELAEEAYRAAEARHRVRSETP